MAPGPTSTDASDPKRALRAEIAARLSSLSPTDHALRSRAIARALESTLRREVPPRLYTVAFHPIAFADSHRLGIVPEPDILPAVEALERDARPLAALHFDWPSRTMHPVAVDDWLADLEPEHGRTHLMNPRPGLAKLPLEHIGAVIVPGVAFDLLGNRLGRGGGFYDRFLASLAPSTLAIGVCFDEQLVPTVPVDGHDVDMQIVITDRERLDLRHV